MSTRDSVRGIYRANDPEMMHAEGSRRFGQAWFAENRRVIHIARNYGLDPTRFMGFFADIAWELCEARNATSGAGSVSPAERDAT